MDQIILKNKLKKLGWTEAPTTGHLYQMSPPKGNMPKQFDLYEAELLQELLEIPSLKSPTANGPP